VLTQQSVVVTLGVSAITYSSIKHANLQLSNLAGITSIPVDLLPFDETQSIGSASANWLSIISREFELNDGTSDLGGLKDSTVGGQVVQSALAGMTLATSSTTTGPDADLIVGTSNRSDTNNVGKVSLLGGDSTAISGTPLGGYIDVIAGDSALGFGGSLTIKSGNGDNPLTAKDSGNVQIQSGDAGSSGIGGTGSVTVRTGQRNGNATATGKSGGLTLQSGNDAGLGGTGNVLLQSGNHSNLTAGNSGNVTIQSGNSQFFGNSGNILIKTGVAFGTKGTITLDTVADGVLLAANPTTVGLQVATTQYVDDATAGGGTAIERTQATHGFTLLDAIYHNGTIWAKAQADVADTLAEYVVSEVVDVNNFVATKFGEVTATAHGLTVGEHYFLSDATAGAGTLTEPSLFSSPLYYVEDVNTLHMEVYRPSDVTDLTAQTIYYPTHVIPALDIDWAEEADTYFKAISVNTTFTWSNDVNGQTILVTVENTDASDHDVIFPITDVHWAGGTSTVSVTANSYSVVTFVRVGAVYMATAVNGLV